MIKIDIKQNIGSGFILIIAIMLILLGFSRMALGYIGEEDSAVITYARRQGGERNEAIPNRYTYSISYTFTLPEGNKVDGFTYKIGSSIYKRSSDTSVVNVRYLKLFPCINALEYDTGLTAGNVILACAGIIIIKLIKSKKKIYRIRKRGVANGEYKY